MIDFLLGLLGLALPVRWTGRRYLEAQLKSNGVDTASLPKDCLQDLTDFSISEAKRLWQPWEKLWKSRIPTLIEGQAVLIASALAGTGSGESYNHLRSIMRRHGVKLKGRDTVMD